MVSIIVPVYNVASYLDSCVDSALQLSVDAEVLLIDDGSTDGSGALCDRWAQRDSRVRVIHRENGGLSVARNTGLQQARGEFVLFLDADDQLDVAETQRLLAQIGENDTVVLGLYTRFYDDGRCEPERCDGFRSVLGDRPVEELLAAVPADGAECYMVAVRFLCRRTFLLENDLLFLPGIYHEDEQWTQRLLCHAKRIRVTDCVFYRYRQRAGSITDRVTAKYLYDCCEIIRCAQTLAAAFPQRAGYLRCRMGMLYLNVLIHVQTMGSDRQALLQQLRQLRACGSYMTGRIGTPARLSMAVLGIGCTARMLAFARKLVK